MNLIKARMLKAGWTTVKKLKYNDLIFHKTGDELRIQITSYSPEKWLCRIEGVVGPNEKYLCFYGFSNPHFADQNISEELEKYGIL